jgi:hypothetical protein
MSAVLETERESEIIRLERIKQIERYSELRKTATAKDLKKAKMTPEFIFGPTEEWLDLILSKYGLNYRAYVIFEALFRQLMAHREVDSQFNYEHDQPDRDFFGKSLSAEKRVELAEAHIKKHRFVRTYGLTDLSFDKKEQVRNLEINLKGDLKKIDSLKRLSSETGSSIMDITAEIEILRAKVLKKAESSMVRKDRPLRGFIKIDKSGNLTVQVSKFDFFRYYCVLYFSLLEPYFRLYKEKNYEIGLHAFIAHKLNFEFGPRLAGLKFSSAAIANKIRDSKGLNHLEGICEKIGLVNPEFYKYIYKNVGREDFILPHTYASDFLNLR